MDFKVLAYKKYNKPGHNTILYQKILMKSVLSGLKLMHVTFDRCLDWLLGSLIINEFLKLKSTGD